MVLGFNHNVMYKGEVFHVQTEDSGVANPHIITLLYRGGVILCSRKTSYADILKMENLEKVVDELMKEQHKEMMRRLKSGEFDDRAFSITSVSPGNPETLPASPIEEAVADIFSSDSTQEPVPFGMDNSLVSEMPVQHDAVTQNQHSADSDVTWKKMATLDEAILAFFALNEK